MAPCCDLGHAWFGTPFLGSDFWIWKSLEQSCFSICYEDLTVSGLARACCYVKLFWILIRPHWGQFWKRILWKICFWYGLMTWPTEACCHVGHARGLNSARPKTIVIKTSQTWYASMIWISTAVCCDVRSFSILNASPWRRGFKV